MEVPEAPPFLLAHAQNIARFRFKVPLDLLTLASTIWLMQHVTGSLRGLYHALIRTMFVEFDLLDLLILRLIHVYVHSIFLQAHQLHTLIGHPIPEPPPFEKVNPTQSRSRRGRQQPRSG